MYFIELLSLFQCSVARPAFTSTMTKQEYICASFSGEYWGTRIHRRFISEISLFLSNVKNEQAERYPLIATFIICMATGLWGLTEQMVTSSPWIWVYFNLINTNLLNESEWLWCILLFYKNIWRNIVYLSYFSPCLKEDMPNYTYSGKCIFMLTAFTRAYSVCSNKFHLTRCIS